ncbi:MAG: DUF6745 domain-containing protein, partial [Thermoguttaceae bacterium]
LAARAALDARNARAALAASSTRAALDASAALDARNARAARDALDARNARDALAERDALDALAARDALDASDAALKRLTQWCIFRQSWYWYCFELSWLSTFYFGALELKKFFVREWTKPLFDAFCNGAWILYWTETTLYWLPKPIVKIEVGTWGRRMHCADGPALECVVENLYFWHGILVPAYAILEPETITINEILNEENAETRRALIELMTPARYLRESKAKLINTDVEGTRKGGAPRALLRDNLDNQWLCGTDGGTGRVYYMPVPADVKNCREAHQAICGFDETLILAKS